MDPKHAPLTLEHLENQKELLMDSYRLISDELRKLQVEEEMMMRKCYELLCARESQNKENAGDFSDDGENKKEIGMVTTSSNGQ